MVTHQQGIKTVLSDDSTNRATYSVLKIRRRYSESRHKVFLSALLIDPDQRERGAHWPESESNLGFFKR
jgi:hypothetical protein